MRIEPYPDHNFAPFPDKDRVMLALHSCKPSSAGCSDCLEPTHLKILIAKSNSETSRSLRHPLTRLCNSFIQDALLEGARDLYSTFNLIALRKRDCGIRLISIGNAFRRIATKVISKYVIPSVAI